MAINFIGGTTSDNYQLISTVTPTAASSAVNFTGLGIYKKLLLWTNGIVPGSAGTITVRLNNDSTNPNYAWSIVSRNFAASNVQIDGGTNSFPCNATSANTTTSSEGWISFNNCDVTGVKFVEAGVFEASGAASLYYTSGSYRGTSVISQVNLLINTTFTAVGTVSLYGVK